MAKQKNTIISQARSLISGVKDRVQGIKQQVSEIKEMQEKSKRQKSLKAIEKELRPANSQNIDITIPSVIKASIAILIIIGLFSFFNQILDIVGLLFISFLLAAALNPFVDMLEKRHIPRGVGALLGYVLILVVLTVLILALVPMLADQGDKLIQTLIQYFSNVAREGITSVPIPFLPKQTEMWMVESINTFRENINIDLIFEQMGGWLTENQSEIRNSLQGVATNFLGVLNVFANGLGNVIILLLLTFFIIVEKNDIKQFFLSLLPIRFQDYFSDKIGTIQTKIGAWVRGQLLLGLAVGLSTYVGFWILLLFGIDIPYKETLSIIAAITELIPVIGPIIAAIFAILVAANVGTAQMIAVLILFIVIQQLENNILVPIIMQHAVGLSPIVIIIGMMIGAKFYGLLGLILAIPISTIIALFVHDFVTKTEHDNEERLKLIKDKK